MSLDMRLSGKEPIEDLIREYIQHYSGTHLCLDVQIYREKIMRRYQHLSLLYDTYCSIIDNASKATSNIKQILLGVLSGIISVAASALITIHCPSVCSIGGAVSCSDSACLAWTRKIVFALMAILFLAIIAFMMADYSQFKIQASYREAKDKVWNDMDLGDFEEEIGEQNKKYQIIIDAAKGRFFEKNRTKVLCEIRLYIGLVLFLLILFLLFFFLYK